MTTQEALQSAQKALEQAIIEKKRGQELLKSLGPAVIETLRPVLDEIAKNSKFSKDELLQAISTIKVASPQIDVPKTQVDVTIPPINIPKIEVPKAEITIKNDPISTVGIESAIEKGLAKFKIPKPEVTVNVPKSDFKMPEFKMPDRMNTELGSVDRKNPLPVRLMDEGGKPFTFTMPGGGKSDFLTIKGIQESAWASVLNPDGRLKVEMPAGASGLTDIELRASSIPVGQVSGSAWSTYISGATGTLAANIVDSSGIAYSGSNPLPISGSLSVSPWGTYYASDAVGSVNVVDAFGSTAVSNVFNADNRLKVSVETGGSGITDSELRASSVPVAQASGSNWSTYITGANGTIGTVTINPDGLPTYAAATSGLTNTELRASSVPVEQVSGSSWSTYVTGSSGSIAVVNLDRDGNPQQAWQVVGITSSVAATLLNGEGVARDTWGATQAGTWNIGTVTTLTGVTNSLAVVRLDRDGTPMGNTVSVSDVFGSIGTNIINPDNRIKVELPTGASGLTDTELRASSLPVWQASGSIWSTAVIDIFGSTAATNVINADNRLKVSVETGGSGITDAEIRASSLPVWQASGSVWSTNLATALDQTIDSISTNQVSGANFSVYVTDIVASSFQTILNPDGRVKVELPTGASGLTNTELRASSVPIEQVSGSNWSTYVTGSSGTTVAVGDIVADGADNESAPIKMGGIARQANPGAVAAGDRVSATFDDLGRQVMRPMQVRDLIATAYVSLATGSNFGTETTLLAASAGFMHDLIYVMGTNDSDAAITVDIRGVTAGSVLMSVRIPANGTAGIATPVPLPQTSIDTGNAWTVDLPDVSGSNVIITALFSREV